MAWFGSRIDKDMFRRGSDIITIGHNCIRIAVRRAVGEGSELSTGPTGGSAGARIANVEVTGSHCCRGSDSWVGRGKQSRLLL